MSENSKETAMRSAENIVEMMQQLEAAIVNGNEEAVDNLTREIYERPLSVEVRSEWHSVGSEIDLSCGEYCILLGTGGPATRIVGIYEDGEAVTAEVQHQDWFEPWCDVPRTPAEILDFARQFSFAR